MNNCDINALRANLQVVKTIILPLCCNIIIGCISGQVRLLNGTQPAVGQREGRVEVCIDNNYGTVCDDSWDVLDARVVCHHLGFTSDGQWDIT